MWSGCRARSAKSRSAFQREASVVAGAGAPVVMAALLSLQHGTVVDEWRRNEPCIAVAALTSGRSLHLMNKVKQARDDQQRDAWGALHMHAQTELLYISCSVARTAPVLASRRLGRGTECRFVYATRRGIVSSGTGTRSGRKLNRNIFRVLWPCVFPAAARREVRSPVRGSAVRGTARANMSGNDNESE